MFIIFAAELVPMEEAHAHYLEKTMASLEEIKDLYNKGILTGKIEAPRIQRQ